MGIELGVFLLLGCVIGLISGLLGVGAVPLLFLRLFSSSQRLELSQE